MTYTYTAVADDSLTGFKSNATGASWPLTVTTPGDGLGHLVTIKNDSVTDHSLKTALLTGTDANDKAQTETMALPNTSATTTSAKYFKTLTTVVPSATIGADTMDIGWSDDAVGPVVPLNHRAKNFNVSVGITVTDTNLDITMQQTLDNPYQSAPHVNCTWYANSSLTAKTANTLGTITSPVRAVRVLVNSVGAASKNLGVKIVEND